MSVTDLLDAIVVALVLTVGFSGILGRKEFRWSDVPLSFFLILLGAWAAAAWLLTFLSDGRSVALAISASLIVAVTCMLLTRPRIRRSIRAAFAPGGGAARFAIVLFFSATFLLLISAIVTRHAVVHLFQASR